MLQVIDRAMCKLSWLPNWTLGIALLIVAVQAADRRKPFALLEVHPASGWPGEIVTIHTDVWRDASRRCSVDVYRSFSDSAGWRWDYAPAYFSYAAIKDTEKKTPGRMSPSFLIPPSAAPGPAEISTSLRYKCNKVHAIWPVEINHTLPLRVLP